MLAIDGQFFITGTLGRRDWLVNLVADPRLVVHLKRRANADRRQTPIDELVANAPMVELTFEDSSPVE